MFVKFDRAGKVCAAVSKQLDMIEATEAAREENDKTGGSDLFEVYFNISRKYTYMK